MEPAYLGSHDDLPVSGHKHGAEGVFAGHGANHLQGRPETPGDVGCGQSAAGWHRLIESQLRRPFPSPRPVPDLDRVPGGRQDGQVVRAEGQRADVGAVAAQREASRLAGVGRLDAEGLHGVVLQQQRHLQLAAGTGQTLHPPGRGDQ